MRVVFLPIQFVTIQLSFVAEQAYAFELGVHCTSDILGAEQFSGSDLFKWAELLSYASAEKMTENGQVEVPMNSVPTAALEMFQPKLPFGFSKTVFDRPTTEIAYLLTWQSNLRKE